MSDPGMSDPERLPFQAFMHAQRLDIVQEIDREITEKLTRYTRVSEAERRASVDAVVGVFLDALTTYHPDAVKRWLSKRMAGVPLDDLLLDSNLKVIAAARNRLVRAARPAVEQGVDGAWEGLCVFSAVSDDMVAALAAFFVDHLGATMRAWRSTEARYQALYLRTPVMMHSIDPTGVLLTVSDRWLDVLGYTRDEVIGKRVFDFLTEESRRYAIEVGLPRFLKLGIVHDVAYDYVKKNGEIVHVLLSGLMERDESGEIIRSLAVLVDVTERRRMEQSLRESEHRYRSIVELSPLGIAVYRNGVLLYMNPAGLRLMRAARVEDFIGTKGIDRVHPDYHHLVWERLRVLKAEGDYVPNHEEVFVRLDGTEMAVEVAVTLIMFEGALAMQSVFADISERKRTEEALRRTAIQDELIRIQEASLRALSTPLIPVSDQVIVMPLVGAIDAGRGARILEVLLQGITAHRASIAILDVTGVPSLDAVVARGLVQATRAVKLLGAEAVLTGISPSSAQALVQMGVDLREVITRATLKDGIDYALRGGLVR